MSLNPLKQDTFPYELTEDENTQLWRWVNGQERIKENRVIRENIKRQAINTFRTKKNKLKMTTMEDN
jgi:hypothetical protein